MKKYLGLLLFCTFLLLSGCSDREEAFGELSKEGIAPYELSENQQQLLESFGMADTSKLIAFLAPKETVTVEVNAYRLSDAGIWDQIGNGAMSADIEGESVSQLAGTIAIELEDDYKIDFHINCSGQGSFSTEEIVLDEEPMGSVKGYLEEFQTIELNEEIPIAVMVYDSGTSMRSYVPQDYYEPSVFKGMDLVQVVTVEFSDKGIGE